MSLAILGLAGVGCWRNPPPTPPPIATTGLDLAVRGLVESALEEVRLSPRSAASWGKLGSVLIHSDFPQEAGLSFEQAGQLDQHDPRWPYLHALLLRSTDPAAALGKFHRAVELAGDTPDTARLQLALLLAEQGHLEEAEEQFQTLLRLTPNHPPAHLGLARLRLSQSQLQQSQQHLESCLENPHTAKAAHALLAQTHFRLANPAAAQRAAHTSSTLPSDLPWPDPFWEETGVHRVGRKALLQDASDWMDQGHLAEATELLRVVTRNYPEDPEGWYLMGWTFNQAGRSVEAEGAIREHLRLSPDSPRGLSQLAVSLLGQRRHQEAAEALRKALDLKPTWRELHYNLGYACLQLSQETEAITHLRHALDLDPAHLPTLNALAEALIGRGQKREARTLLRRALDIDPANPRAQSLLKPL